MKGIIDRFEGDIAVILIEAENREIHIPANKLPEECTVKSMVNIKASEENTHSEVSLDPDSDHQNKQKSNDLRKALLNRKKGSKLKRRK
ncbi:DUF3006 domain-containing protein [Oceanobacillus sp. CFH 90083]|uniref:DUF3006 domain-containing protein n=1 Tax=Oceanobacillus sp. CFH 90083 TaxID=2592336 RepID=UPI00128DB2DF|nr:DUF3006 domain-containing protein [Oceanobacillus sp. CFH 90083]